MSTPNTSGTDTASSPPSFPPPPKKPQKRQRPCNPFFDDDGEDEDNISRSPSQHSARSVTPTNDPPEGHINAETLRSFLEAATKLKISRPSNDELTSDSLRDCLKLLGSPEEKPAARRILELYRFAERVYEELDDKQKKSLASTGVQKLICGKIKAKLLEGKPWLDYEQSTETVISLMLFRLDPGNASRGFRAQSVCYNAGFKWLQLMTVEPTRLPANNKADDVARQLRPESSPAPPESRTVGGGYPTDNDPSTTHSFEDASSEAIPRKQSTNTATLETLVETAMGLEFLSLRDVSLTDEQLSQCRDALKLREPEQRAGPQVRKWLTQPHRYAGSRAVDVYKAGVAVLSSISENSTERSRAPQLEKMISEKTVDVIMAENPWKDHRQAAETLVPILLFKLYTPITSQHKLQASLGVTAEKLEAATKDWLWARVRLPTVLTAHEVMLEKFLNCTFISFVYNAHPEVCTESQLWELLSVLGLRQYLHSTSDARTTFQRRTTQIYKTAVDAFKQTEETGGSIELYEVADKTLALLQPQEAHGGVSWRTLSKTNKEVAVQIIWILLQKCRVASWAERIAVGVDLTLPVLCEDAATNFFRLRDDAFDDATLSSNGSIQSESPPPSSPPASSPVRAPQGLAAYTMDSGYEPASSRRCKRTGSPADNVAKKARPAQKPRTEEYNAERYKLEIDTGVRQPGEPYTSDMIQFSMLDLIANWDELAKFQEPERFSVLFSMSLMDSTTAHWDKMNEEQKAYANRLVEEIKTREIKVDRWFNNLCATVAGTGISKTVIESGLMFDPIGRIWFRRDPADIIQIHISNKMAEGDPLKKKATRLLEGRSGVYEQSLGLILIQRQLLEHLQVSGEFKSTIQEAREKWKQSCKERGVHGLGMDAQRPNETNMTLWKSFPCFSKSSRSKLRWLLG